MHSLFLALLLTLWAFAGRMDPEHPEGVNQTTCHSMRLTYECADFHNARDPHFEKIEERYCGKLPCPGGDSELCKTTCATGMDHERAYVCKKCPLDAKIPILASPSGPSPPPSSSPAPGISPSPDPVKPSSPVLPSPSSKPAIPTPGGKSGSGGSPPPSRGSDLTGVSCTAAADCDQRGGSAHQGGETEARDRRETFDAGNEGSRDNTSKSITGAMKMLKRLQDAAAVNSSPEVRARLANDQRQVFKADDALGPSRIGTFKPEDAQNVFDPGIRTQLTQAAQSALMAEDFSQESAKAKKMEDEFHALATESFQHADALGSTRSSIAEAPGTVAAVAKAASVISESSLGASGAGTVKFNAQISTSSNAAKNSKGAGGVNDSAAHAAAYAAEAAGGASLRDRLRRQLAYKAHSEALDATAFNGGLKPLMAAPKEVSHSSGNAAEDAIATAFNGIHNSSFALGSSAATEAELRRLTQDHDQDWLPAADSPSLFERAHRAHRACQQRSCVVSAAP